jgi:amino acid transporter
MEAHFIGDLLESNDINFHIVSKSIGPVTGDLEELMPIFNIFVHKNDLLIAKDLLKSSKDNTEDVEFRKYVQERKARNKIIGRVLALMASAFFFGLSFLPIKTSENLMKYTLYGASIFMFLFFIFSFYQSKK